MRKFIMSAVAAALLLAAACGYPGVSPPPNTCVEGTVVGIEWDGDIQYDLNGNGKVDCKITTNGEVICLDDTEWSINHRPDYYRPSSTPSGTAPPVPAAPEQTSSPSRPPPTVTCTVRPT